MSLNKTEIALIRLIKKSNPSDEYAEALRESDDYARSEIKDKLIPLESSMTEQLNFHQKQVDDLTDKLAVVSEMKEKLQKTN